MLLLYSTVCTEIDALRGPIRSTLHFCLNSADKSLQKIPNNSLNVYKKLGVIFLPQT